MKIATLYLCLLSLIFLSSCMKPSYVDIQQLDSPEASLHQHFGLNITGEVHYQYYQKYLHKEEREQLILILSPDSTNMKGGQLPLDQQLMEDFLWIDGKKYQEGSEISLEQLRLESQEQRTQAKEFVKDRLPAVSHQQGIWSLVQDDSTETLFVYDPAQQLLFIESKK
ncbi:MAG: hypothetical protein AAFY71_16335 [Bacteroidota bacterium]